MGIGLLIGANCLKALEPNKIIPSRNGGPYAFRTILGWCVVGPVQKEVDLERNLSCHRVSVIEIGSNKIANHHFVIEKSVEDMGIKQMLQKIDLHEFTEPRLKDDKSLSEFKNGISAEDKRFLKVMKENTVLVNGHYQIPLPLKDLDVKFPNNKKQAEKRLEGLQKRFKRDQKFFQQYKQFMEDTIGNGFAEKCKIEGKEGRCWYLPHHGVYHPQKPGKMRVVFD